MRRLPAFVALLAGLPLAAQPPADPPPGALPPFPGPTVSKVTLERAIALYLDPAVQAELKLTADQKAALAKLADDALARHTDAIAKLDAARKGAVADREKANAKQVADSEAALANHLSAGQVTRVRQLRLQMLGLTAFRVPEVAAAVKLSAEQVKALDAAGAEISRGFDQAPAPGEAAPPRPPFAARAEASKKAFERFVAGLTAEQRAAWAGLAGEPSAAVGNLTSFPAARSAPPAALMQRMLLSQLARNEALQKELKLTPEHVKGVGEAMAAMQPSIGGVRDLALVRTVTTEVAAGADKVLTREQAARLAQVRRQLAGLAAFADVEVLKAVKLTPEQARRVEAAGAEVLRTAGPRPGFARDGTAPAVEQRRQRMEAYTAKAVALDTAAAAAFVATLDPAQRRAWDGLVGPPFDLAKLGPAATGFRPVGATGIAPDGTTVFLGRGVSPADAWASHARRLVAAGKPAEAVAAYDEALRLKPDAADHMTSLAWLLATHPDDRVRDGRRAVDLAETACGKVKSPSASDLGTLAAAYAEAGRFDEAVTAQEKALAAAGRATAPWVSYANRPQGDSARLKLYREGKPFREGRD